MPRESAGLFLYRRTLAPWRCSWCILAALSGRRKTKEPGRSPKANLTRTRIRSRLPSENFERKLAWLPGRISTSESCSAKRRKDRLCVGSACDVEAAAARSNAFPMEWPPGSGKIREFPEIDRAEWFKIELARRKILKSQLGLLEQLKQAVASRQVSREIPGGLHSLPSPQPFELFLAGRS